MLAHLRNRRELAIHSDVITEPIVDLVDAGVVTGPVATSYAMGTRRLYDLVDGNPRFACIRSTTSATRRSSRAGSG
jgi:acyl-CoA hydrolase